MEKGGEAVESSDGTGAYKIVRAKGSHRAGKLIIRLDKSCEFVNSQNIEPVIRNLPPFVPKYVSTYEASKNDATLPPAVTASWKMQTSDFTSKQLGEFQNSFWACLGNF